MNWRSEQAQALCARIENGQSIVCLAPYLEGPPTFFPKRPCPPLVPFAEVGARTWQDLSALQQRARTQALRWRYLSAVSN
jgi:hypothetical protein